MPEGEEAEQQAAAVQWQHHRLHTLPPPVGRWKVWQVRGAMEAVERVVVA